ncbi:16S rRNA (cytosine(967)-C(5))-methyltransferase RsmB [Aeribacillus pallidus]|uniref:16S rRNA (cytosine(967)-C(5))-methyltransferase RsmB n=1 Tax=Aeribacillus pallidus TaxID=33936 RepID=UPI003D1C9F51
MSKTKNVREVALDVLLAVEKHQSYSNILLNHVIKEHQLPPKDTALLTELTYGTIQRQYTLDYFLAPFLKKPKKLQSWVRQLLRLSLYQMVFLDKIPDRAVIHEAVEIAKRKGHRGIAGLVNGVLRSVQREGVPSLDQISDPIERISIETSHPIWLVKRWVEQFGLERTKQMCEENLIAPVQTVRTNTVQLSREQLLDQLTNDGWNVQPSPIVPEGIRSLRGNLAHSQAFNEGLLTVQDESSMLVAHALKLTPGMKVLDCCAAPGGKTTHIAEMMDNEGEVWALDLHEHKVKLIEEQRNRLKLTIIHTKCIDSRKAGDYFANETFDRVLVDAPCSGLGVLRRKPDIKYSKNVEDVQALKSVQQSILHAVAPLVKQGGILVYSTCTVDRDENDRVIEQFLQQHPEYMPEPLSLPEPVQPLVNGHQVQVFPQDFGSDGFYIACLRKKVK